MSGRKLFVQRCWEDLKFQGRAFRSVIDWTIFLYLFVPGVIILIIINRSWWLDTPQWMQGVPIEALLIVFSLVSWIGGYRTFLLEADQLFLLQKKNLVASLKKWAILFSVFLQWIGMLLVFVLTLPFLIGHYTLEPAEVVFLFLFFSLFKSFILWTKHRFGAMANFWVKTLLSGVFFLLSVFVTVSISASFVAGHPLGLSLASAFLSIALCMGFHSWVTNHSNVLTDMEYDRKQKLKYVQFILMNSAVIPRQMNFSRKRPWLFRSSGRIYQHRSTENGLAELFLKVFFRNGMYTLNYLQITGVTLSGLVVVPPIWLKCVLYLMFLLFTKVWMDSVWKTITSKPLLATLVKDDQRMLTAKRRVLWLFLTPMYVSVAIIAALAAWISSMVQ